MLVYGRVLVDERTEPDQAMLAHTHKFADEMDKLLNKECGYTGVDLESRFEKLRT
jgi:2',3'-cyclic-nucleotide 2'-phosphodiesterase (5'-nucleotidase family)